MIVAHDLAKAICRGAVTQLRLLASRQRVGERVEYEAGPGGKRRAKLVNPRSVATTSAIGVDDDIPISYRSPDGEPVLPCRATVTARRRERLGDATEADAAAMGFDSLVAFRWWWVWQHDERWATVNDVPERVRVVDGEERVQEAIPLTQDNVDERFRARWATRDVWVLDLRVATDRPRYLAPAGRPRGSELGYTRSQSQAIDDREAVDEVTLQRFSKDAEERGKIMRHERLLMERARSLGRRVREEALRTGRAGIDVSRELDEIEAQLREIERKRAA